MEIAVVNVDNNIVDRVEIRGDIADYPVKSHAVWQTVRWQLARRRRGTHATRTRAMVRGGGRKPWSQKHTGRARQGSIRAPQWVGGGVVFGPQPLDHSFKLPVRVRKVALRSVFAGRLREGELIVVEDFSIDEPRTKRAVEILKKLGVDDKKVLFIVNAVDEYTYKSFRNLANVKFLPVEGMNVYDLLNCDVCVVFRSALPSIEKRLTE